MFSASAGVRYSNIIGETGSLESTATVTSSFSNSTGFPLFIFLAWKLISLLIMLIHVIITCHNLCTNHNVETNKILPPIKYFTDGAKAVLLLWIYCVFSMPLFASVYMCLVVTCWERAGLLALICGV